MVKIFNDQNNPNVWKALIAAKYNGVEVETHFGNDATATLKNSPVEGKGPVLQADQGTVYGANAVARYVARLGKNKLYGANTFESGLVEQWIEFASSEIDLPASVWIYPILGYIPNNENATGKAKADIKKVLDALNKHLNANTFLVGHRITLADIVVAMSLYYLYQKVLDAPFRKASVNTNRWYLTVVNQPEFKSVIGEVKLCEKTEVASNAPVKTATKEKEQPKKQEKPAEKPAKKAEPKEEEEESLEDDKPKAKNPLDLLPPSKFILDDWKRKFSNSDARSAALPWFWENIDKEGYSVWFGDYKYNDELLKTFMTLNLINGFLQRLEKLRKYGFGSIILFGDEPKMEISACFLVRGLNMPQEMHDCDDVEHYTWRKADLNDEATRELINDFFSWDGKLGGKKFNQGKIFK